MIIEIALGIVLGMILLQAVPSILFLVGIGLFLGLIAIPFAMVGEAWGILAAIVAMAMPITWAVMTWFERRAQQQRRRDRVRRKETR
jgi:ABC-type polysaccharide/polyol phosphate export permease